MEFSGKRTQTPKAARSSVQAHMPTGPHLKTSGYGKNGKSSPGVSIIALCPRHPGEGEGVLVLPSKTSALLHVHQMPWGKEEKLHPSEAGYQPVPWAAGSPGGRSSGSKQLEHVSFCWGWETGDRSPSEPSCKVGLKHIHSRWCCRPHSGFSFLIICAVSKTINPPRKTAPSTLNHMKRQFFPRTGHLGQQQRESRAALCSIRDLTLPGRSRPPWAISPSSDLRGPLHASHGRPSRL